MLLCLTAVAETRWTIDSTTKTIVMDAAANAPHKDHIEMSGLKAAIVYYWSIDEDGRYGCEYHHIFPLLRTIPNNTHGFFPYNHTTNVAGMIKADGKVPDFKAVKIELDGTLRVTETALGLELSRVNFPSTSEQAVYELFYVKNVSDKPVKLDVPDYKYTWESDPARGVKGSYVMDFELVFGGETILEPGDTRFFFLVMQAYEKNEAETKRIDPDTIDFPAEYAARLDLFKQLSDNLILDTPDEVINTEFRYAKLRASESIIATKGGLMHAPGGEAYYAALWCNDQCEYVNRLRNRREIGLRLLQAVFPFYERCLRANPQFHNCRRRRYLERSRRPRRCRNDSLWRQPLLSGMCRPAGCRGPLAADRMVP